MPDKNIGELDAHTLAATSKVPAWNGAATQAFTAANLKTALGYGGVVELFPATCRYSSVADSAAIASTTAETAFSTTYSIPAGLLAVGSSIRVSAYGKHSTTGTPAIVLRVKLGGTIIANQQLTCGSSVTDRAWLAEGSAVVRTLGASGTAALGAGLIAVGSTASGGLAAGTMTINTTAAVAVTVTAEWSASSASNTITLQSLRVWIEHPGVTA